MTLLKELQQGDELNNSQLANIFKCAPQGGMRRSHRTNTLVVISDPFKSLYKDRWQEETFFYTGMGQSGNQSFYHSQNKTLFNSNNSDIEVYLFEVFEEKVYTYIGKVRLCETPFYERQLDKDGIDRDVCIFPLELIDNKPILLEEKINKKTELKQNKEAQKLKTDDLLKRALSSNQEPGKRNVISSTFERDQYVVEYAKRWAKGYCQLCEEMAPFNDKKGNPFLHTHHIDWLSRGGLDTIANTIALCPNCHNKMHVLADTNDIEKLKEKVNLHLSFLVRIKQEETK